MKIKGFLYALAAMANIGVDLFVFAIIFGRTNIEAFEVIAITVVLTTMLMLPIYIKVEEVGKKNETRREMLKRSDNQRSRYERF